MPPQNYMKMHWTNNSPLPLPIDLIVWKLEITFRFMVTTVSKKGHMSQLSCLLVKKSQWKLLLVGLIFHTWIQFLSKEMWIFKSSYVHQGSVPVAPVKYRSVRYIDTLGTLKGTQQYINSLNADDSPFHFTCQACQASSKVIYNCIIRFLHNVNSHLSTQIITPIGFVYPSLPMFGCLQLNTKITASDQRKPDIFVRLVLFFSETNQITVSDKKLIVIFKRTWKTMKLIGYTLTIKTICI